MSDLETPAFVVHPAASPEVPLRDIEDLRGWIRAQEEGFEWFTRDRNSSCRFAGLSVPDIRNYIQVLRSKANQLAADPIQTHHVELQNHLSKWRDEGPRFAAGDARVTYCKAIKDPEEGVRTFLAFMTKHWQRQDGVACDRTAARAAFNVMTFDRMLDTSALSARAEEADDLIRNVKNHLEGARHDRDDARAQFDARIQVLNERMEAKETEQSAVIEHFTSELSEKRESAIQEFDAFRKAVLDDIKLEAPVHYWKTRSTGMGKTATYAAIAFIVLFSLVAWAFGTYAKQLLAEEMPLPQRLWTMTVLLAVLGFVSWPLRLISRLYMSAIHLRADAEERRTMVMTYLALLKENAVDPKHREIVLASLFRPSPTGLISDDGAPSGFADALKAIKSTP